MTKVAHLDAGGLIEEVVAWILESPECQLHYWNNQIFDQITAPDPLPLDVERLYVCHVPKTGGISLREMLRSHFNEYEFCGGVGLAQLYRMSHYRLRTFRVIVGHFGPTLPKLLPEVPLVTATMLRDPLEVIISHYGHWRDQGALGNPLTDMARSMPLEEWCHSDDTRGLWSNPQANQLTSERVPLGRSQAGLWPEGAVSPVHESELLERAASRLDEIDIVGTTGHIFDVYLACLERLREQPRHLRPLRENVGAGIAASLSNSTRDWLLEHNRIDSQLFETAQGRSAELGSQRTSDEVRRDPEDR